MNFYKFEKLLTKALIISRPNRFIMDVLINGKIKKFHCPATGRIGNINFKDIPCLVSLSEDSNRKTNGTVEAIQINNIWIGINQNKVNKYLEFFINNHSLSTMIKEQVVREQKLGNSRIDFASQSTFLEVKMPLTHLPINNMEKLEHKNFNSFDRLIKHFNDLALSLKKGKRALVLTCFMFDAPPFVPPAPNRDNSEVREAIKNALTKGVESWQVNLGISEEGVKLISYFKLHLFE